jgi:hypothetical protein
MLKNFGYDGTYNDENITVSVLLENPSDYGLEATNLVFNVTLRTKNSYTINTRLEDFEFYVMDEANHLYSTYRIPYSKSEAKADPDDDEPIHQPDGLILTEFNPGFLFQDLRIAFYYQLYRKINIIELSH